MVKWYWGDNGKNSLHFTPYQNTEFVKIQLSNLDGSSTLNFELNNINMKFYYILYLSEDLKGKDLIARGYNSKGELKTLKYISS